MSESMPGGRRRPGSPSPHPLQPLLLDEHGVLRFRANAIVRFLLDAGPFDLNQLAAMEFSRQDREQFAQLIGYSLSGFGELSYVSDEAYEAAAATHEAGMGAAEARASALRERLKAAKAGMRAGVAALYGIHPDDLGEQAVKTELLTPRQVAETLRQAGNLPELLSRARAAFERAGLGSPSLKEACALCPDFEALALAIEADGAAREQLVAALTDIADFAGKTLCGRFASDVLAKVKGEQP